jgi:CRP/FNR family transcriptional regulator
LWDQSPQVAGYGGFNSAKKPITIDLHQSAHGQSAKLRCDLAGPVHSVASARSTLEWCMKISLAAGKPNGQVCAECAIRQFNICATLDKSELRELEHLGRHAHFTSGETVFAREELTTSVYNLLEGVLRLYKLLPDGRRQIVGFALPGDFLGMTASACHSFSADAIGAVEVCKFPKTSFVQFIENRPHLLRRINELAIRELCQ